jgi:hypothetical protein
MSVNRIVYHVHLSQRRIRLKAPPLGEEVFAAHDPIKKPIQQRDYYSTRRFKD